MKITKTPFPQPSQEKTPLNLLETPKELQELIITFLDEKSTGALAQTNKSFHTLISSSKPIQTRFLGGFAYAQLLKAKEQALSSSTPFQALINVAKAEIQIGAIEDARKTLEQAKKEVLDKYSPSIHKDTRPLALAEIGTAQAHIKAIEEALETLDQAKQEAQVLFTDIVALKILTKIAIAQNQINAIEEAKKTLSLAKEKAAFLENTHLSPLAQAKVAEAESKINAENVKKTLAHAKKEATSLQDISYKSKRFIDIAKAEVQIGTIKDAKKTLARAKKEIFSTNFRFFDKSLILTKSAKILVQISTTEEAKETLDQAKENVNKALDHALLMNSSISSQFTVLIKIAKVQVQINAIKEAKETLDQACFIARIHGTDFTESETKQKIKKIQYAINTITLKTEVEKGNIVAVRQRLHKTPLTSVEGHLNMVYRTLKLADTVLQSTTID